MNIDERAQRFAEILLAKGHNDVDAISLKSYNLARRMHEEAQKGVPEIDWDELTGFKVDWGQAPSRFVTHWSMEGNGECTWWIDEPCIDSETHFENPENPHSFCHSDAPSFNYKGNWQDSLRKRP